MWWTVLVASEQLGVAPWELAAQSPYWMHAALLKRQLEHELQAMHDRANKRGGDL